MLTAVASAREILVRLHDVMASRTPAQAKLNSVVQIVGEGMSSEVCSIYLLRDGALELYATRGLAQEAVHVTKLAPGEGLVGTIAQNVETLNLDEAASHPDFAYRPETGEDKYHSFAGVPIIRRDTRGGRRTGEFCSCVGDPALLGSGTVGHYPWHSSCASASPARVAPFLFTAPRIAEPSRCRCTNTDARTAATSSISSSHSRMTP